MSNDEGTEDFWLVWPLRQAIRYRLMGFKRHSWHWAEPQTRPSWLVRFCNTHNGDWNMFEVGLAFWQIAHERWQHNIVEIDTAMQKAERAAEVAQAARGE